MWAMDFVAAEFSLDWPRCAKSAASGDFSSLSRGAFLAALKEGTEALGCWSVDENSCVQLEPEREEILNSTVPLAARRVASWACADSADSAWNTRFSKCSVAESPDISSAAAVAISTSKAARSSEF